MSLLPHDEKFYDLLTKQAKIAAEASSILAKAGSSGEADSGFGLAAEQIRTLEQKGDDLLHDIDRRLHKTFITPLDPEDIHALASHIDEVLDHLDGTAYRLDAFGFDKPPAKLADLTRMVDSCVRKVAQAFEFLEKEGVKKPDELTQQCDEINRLESETETQVRQAIRDLSASEKDAISLIKQKEIYEFLERTADLCEDLADILAAVAVKNS